MTHLYIVEDIDKVTLLFNNTVVNVTTMPPIYVSLNVKDKAQDRGGWNSFMIGIVYELYIQPRENELRLIKANILIRKTFEAMTQSNPTFPDQLRVFRITNVCATTFHGLASTGCYAFVSRVKTFLPVAGTA